MLNPLRLATRESMLALKQTHIVINLLSKKFPDLATQIIGMTTEGDQRLDISLAKIGGKGLFVKALEEALLENRADCAVHSMKDVPMLLPGSLTIAAILTREDPRDVFVSNHYASLADLPPGAIVGTSSLRRHCFVLDTRSDVQVKFLRGNVATRLRKLDEGEYDAIILAFAGLHRLNLTDRIKQYLSTDEFIPAVGQGAIGIECKEQSSAYDLLHTLNDINTAYCIQAERAVSRALQASCHVPLAAFAQIELNQIHLKAMLGNPKNNQRLFASQSGPVDLAEKIGLDVANSLLSQGAKSILEQF